MSTIAEIPPSPSVIKTEQSMAMNFVPILDRPLSPAETREDDFTLLKRYADLSDPQAFAQIVQRYASFVYATCLRVIGDGSRAEDLSQETFFRLMRRPHEVRQNLGGWLHRTATHLALDSLRSENSRKFCHSFVTVFCTNVTVSTLNTRGPA